jgi:hypothetical protein
MSSVPAHVVLTPTDNSGLLNFMNLDNIGISTVKDSTAFKKIQFFSKSNPSSLFNVKSDFQNSFDKLSNYYLTDLDLNQSYTYGMDRQHTYAPLASSLPMFNTLMDLNSSEKFFSYNLGTKTPSNKNILAINRLNSVGDVSDSSYTNSITPNLTKLLPNPKLNAFDFSWFLKVPKNSLVLGSENDSKQYSNDFKFTLNTKSKKKSINNLNYLMGNIGPNSDSTTQAYNPNNSLNSLVFNTDNNLKFKDYKSSNAQFLGSERTARLLTNLNSKSFKWNLSASPNSVTSVSNNLLNYGNSQNYLYSSSVSN